MITLHDRHAKLMEDIRVCDNMIDPEYYEDQSDLIADLENMCQELSELEEVMFLKDHVYCGCYDGAPWQ